MLRGTQFSGTLLRVALPPVPGDLAARSAKVAAALQGGYQDWLDSLSARIADATEALQDLATARTTSDLLELHRRIVESATARSADEIRSLIGLSNAIAAALTAGPLAADSLIPYTAAPTPAVRTVVETVVEAAPEPAPAAEARAEPEIVAEPAPERLKTFRRRSALGSDGES